jgi:hypothetical protein
MSCHARNYGTGRTRFQLQFPIAVCERLITLPNTVSLVERSNLSCHSLSGISMQPNSCIYVAIATRLASRTRKWLVRRCPRPAACTGNRATVRCQKTCCEKCVWNRTQPGYIRTQSFALTRAVSSLDHLVGAGEQRGWHFETERLRCMSTQTAMLSEDALSQGHT